MPKQEPAQLPDASEAFRTSAFRAAFEASPVGILMVGLDGKITAANERFREFVGLDADEFGCTIDRMNGAISLWRNTFDEAGQIVGREEIPMEQLGRIPAQTAKQVMIQKFREDERNSLLDEFSKRQGEIVTGTAHRYEGGALIVQIDRAEGIMRRSEQIPGEQFHPGDRVRCLILDVREEGNQVKIFLSRSTSKSGTITACRRSDAGAPGWVRPMTHSSLMNGDCA